MNTKCCCHHRHLCNRGPSGSWAPAGSSHCTPRQPCTVRTLEGAGSTPICELPQGGWDHGGRSIQRHDTALILGGGPAAHCRCLDPAACPSAQGLAGKAGTAALVPGTHPRPRQPSLRLTSRCSSPSNRERRSGEKESGSSTAYREEGQDIGRAKKGAGRQGWGSRSPVPGEPGPSTLSHPQQACLLCQQRERGT